MSILVESSMGELNEDRRGIYPMFQKGAKPNDAEAITDTNDFKFLKGQADVVEANPKDAPSRISKRPKISEASKSKNSEKATTSFVQNHAELLEIDPNNTRRKRRKTASLDGTESTGEEELSYQQTNSFSLLPVNSTAHNLHEGLASIPQIIDLTVDGLPRGSPQKSHGHVNGSNLVSLDPVEQDVRNVSVLKSTHKNESRPKKILQLNTKTGTFGSPPHKSGSKAEPKSKRSSGRAKLPRSRLVTIRYDSGVGIKINQILQSVKSTKSSSDPSLQPTVLSRPAETPRLLHPLFLGKLASKIGQCKAPTKDSEVIDLTLISSPSKSKSAITQAVTCQSNVIFSGFGKTSKLIKFPGTMEPAWPWKGIVHVRGNDSGCPPLNRLPSNSAGEKIVKKSKGNATNVPASEDIIEVLAKNLHVDEIAKSLLQIDLDVYPKVPPSLRSAVKHHESGACVQRRLRRELHLRPRIRASHQLVDSSSDDDFHLNRLKGAPIHPALAKRYASIATSLSAFDKGQCESQGWTYKYAPQCASEVLQTGDEANILKGWLNALTVNVVLASTSLSLPMKPAKKRRKTKKLDGFIVSSDEEDFLQNATSENDTDMSRSNGGKTFIRKGLSKETGKPSNAILVSGPHGCGKTAAVYAVARELGFEVFEINSSSRRSGKDITDRVGDMTRNHLVQHSTFQASIELNADEQRIDDALADDLKSGRQGTMSSFFTSTSSKPKTTSAKMSNEKLIEGKATSRQPAREQKQSLILIEEVDVLYKEDSQFWPTIINLIQSSRRPIIMTCNDESLVDTSLLSLHGILRFTPPPLNLAVDYMLMIAACEGHILKREAVVGVYENRGLDLRASLTDLNYWCQFGVGSIKGGLDWYYSRFPRGSDVDKDGNTIRVISEDTFRAGMGCLSQDHLASRLHSLDIEEELLRETWDGWQLDVGEWQADLNLESWADHPHAETTQLTNLSMYEDFAETMSTADLISRGAMATDLKSMLDTSTLKPTQKALDSYTLPFRILEASPIVDYSVTKEISTWLRSRAKAYLHIKHGLETLTEMDRLSESRLVHQIQKQAASPGKHICRKDFDSAFEPISNADKPYVWSTSPSLISVFLGTLGPIVEDAAPYVRSIVAYDARLAQERVRMSSLLSEGGKSGKRMRKTRAAMSALEGGARGETRRERYFNDQLNMYLVAKTGVQSWIDASVAQTDMQRLAAAAIDSRRSSNGSVESGNTEITIDGQIGE